MNTKTLLLAVVFTSSIIHHPSSISFAQAPNWAWAKSAGGTSGAGGSSISTDNSGNVYVTGDFYSPSITFGTTTLTNADNTWNTGDIFIVKYSPSGNVLWAQSAGGTSGDWCNSVSTDSSGNVYVTGYFYSPSITFGTTTLTNADNTGNSYDVFIVKYSPSGNILWAQSAGGTFYDEGKSVSTDDSGNVYVTGDFYSPSITFGTTTLTNADNTGNSYDIFIVKYSSSGNILWAQSAGGNLSDWGNSVSTDESGNVYVTGYFESPSITFGTTTLTNAGVADIFLVKYSPSGNILWAQSAGGTSLDEGFSVSTDASGNVYVTGNFASPSITFGTTTLTNADNTGSSYDVFIVKYSPSGNILWAKTAGGNSYDWGYSVSTDAGGNVFVTGYFWSQTITFGTTTLTNANTGTKDIFIAKLDSILTGIESPLTTENEMIIYPNPTSGMFQIQLATGNWQLASSQKQEASIEIYNVYGEKVYSSIIHHPSSIIHLKAPSGIYFLQIKTEQGVVNRKLIISK